VDERVSVDELGTLARILSGVVRRFGAQAA
jgi:hypothetical protein